MKYVYNFVKNYQSGKKSHFLWYTLYITLYSDTFITLIEITVEIQSLLSAAFDQGMGEPTPKSEVTIQENDTIHET